MMEDMPGSSREKGTDICSGYPEMSSPSIFSAHLVLTAVARFTVRTAATEYFRSGPATQPIDLSTFAFGGPAGSPITHRDSWHGLPGGRWRTAVDQAFRHQGRPYPLRDRPDDLDDALTPVEPDSDLITGTHQLGRLGGDVVDPDMAGPTGGGRR
jgi:hypothetical protein